MKYALSVLALVVLSVVPSWGQDQGCPPPFSVSDIHIPCQPGRLCESRSGEQIEVLAIDPLSGKASVRDFTRRICRDWFGTPAGMSVLWAAVKEFRQADCQLPLWVLEEEFLAYPRECYQPSSVLTITRGLVTIGTKGYR